MVRQRNRLNYGEKIIKEGGAIETENNAFRNNYCDAHAHPYPCRLRRPNPKRPAG